VIFNSESPFKRLEHYKIHEYTRKWNLNKVEPISMTQTTNVDTMFKRKRGRPPKNRVVEVRNIISPSFDVCPLCLSSCFSNSYSLFLSLFFFLSIHLLSYYYYYYCSAPYPSGTKRSGMRT
ncbi:Uncharacterized protein FKW44_010696, partial [Caligus rogercresseyi]